MPIPVTEEFVAITGARLWTARQGSGPGMALCHGGAGMWGLPRPGGVDGRRPGDRSPLRPASVWALVRRRTLHGGRLSRRSRSAAGHWGYERWIVGGHSWGASLALAYCLPIRRGHWASCISPAPG